MSEKQMLIRMIRDYVPHMKAADLARLSFEDLATLYKQLRGY